jgi:hypothetical protein
MHFHLPKPLHGWRAFAGEVGIIVIGVLLALSAEQLVEWLHWRHQQHDTLERLFQESRTNVALLREGRDRLIKRAQQEEEFAAAITHGSCPAPGQWIAATDVSKYPQVAVETSVYDEVVGSGGLANIQSTRVREAISDFHSKIAWLQNTTEFFRSNAKAPFDFADTRLTVTYDPKASEPETVSFDRQALCRDKGFRNRVADSVRNQVVWTNFHQGLVDSAINMCAVVGHEIGKDCTPAGGPPFTDAERRIAAAAAGRR